MKSFLLLLSLLVATPAFADNVDSFTWNPITKQLQAVTHSNGTKTVAQSSKVYIGSGYTGSTSTCATGAGAFGTFSTSVVLTFTPVVTGTYQTFSAPLVFNNTNSARTYLRIVATAGAPTNLFTQDGVYDDLASLTNAIVTLPTSRIDTLTAGTSYTYALECDVSTGTATLRGDQTLSGIALTSIYVGN